jgi:hypothetical protein
MDITDAETERLAAEHKARQEAEYAAWETRTD